MSKEELDTKLEELFKEASMETKLGALHKILWWLMNKVENNEEYLEELMWLIIKEKKGDVFV